MTQEAFAPKAKAESEGGKKPCLKDVLTLFPNETGKTPTSTTTRVNGTIVSGYGDFNYKIVDNMIEVSTNRVHFIETNPEGEKLREYWMKSNSYGETLDGPELDYTKKGITVFKENTSIPYSDDWITSNGICFDNATGQIKESKEMEYGGDFTIDPQFIMRLIEKKKNGKAKDNAKDFAQSIMSDYGLNLSDYQYSYKEEQIRPHVFNGEFQIEVNSERKEINIYEGDAKLFDNPIFMFSNDGVVMNDYFVRNEIMERAMEEVSRTAAVTMVQDNLREEARKYAMQHLRHENYMLSRPVVEQIKESAPKVQEVFDSITNKTSESTDKVDGIIDKYESLPGEDKLSLATDPKTEELTHQLEILCAIRRDPTVAQHLGHHEAEVKVEERTVSDKTEKQVQKQEETRKQPVTPIKPKQPTINKPGGNGGRGGR